MLSAWADLHGAGAPGSLGIFATSSCRIGEDRKTVLPFEREVPGTVPYGKSGPDYCITFTKRLDEDLR